MKFIYSKIFLIFYCINLLLKNSFYIFIQKGQLLSAWKWSALNQRGEPTPWYTYPALEYLDGIDFRNKVIFEFGSGNSTLYWARVAKKVISVEGDLQWYQKMKMGIPKNVSYVFARNKRDYLSALSDTKIHFDVIVIDGEFREECYHLALNKMADNGMIIFDNSDRYGAFLKKNQKLHPGIRVDFYGLGPINAYPWCTTLLVSRKSNLAHK